MIEMFIFPWKFQKKFVEIFWKFGQAISCSPSHFKLLGSFHCYNHFSFLVVLDNLNNLRSAFFDYYFPKMNDMGSSWCQDTNCSFLRNIS